MGSLLIAGIIGYGVYWAFFDMNRLPRVYVTNGGATTSYAVRGELVCNEQNNKTKNIYWNNRENTANITWNDNDTVIINGHKLDVPNDKFDFRNQ
ncbi:DUF5412 family protein [Bacillus pseudomycoides]|uniref:DUF5412 family protein n=1 Tax=Bacillus pseudomycoides TaxID=64104 RepID=UPI001FB3BAAD|nr:DUF5412 family protein [Bacillus pseudomycoides]